MIKIHSSKPVLVIWHGGHFQSGAGGDWCAVAHPDMHLQQPICSFFLWKKWQKGGAEKRRLNNIYAV